MLGNILSINDIVEIRFEFFYRIILKGNNCKGKRFVNL